MDNFKNSYSPIALIGIKGAKLELVNYTIILFFVALFIIAVLINMFRLNKYSNILANRLIILNFSNACSAKIKELDLTSLRDSDSFNLPRVFAKLLKLLT